MSLSRSKNNLFLARSRNTRSPFCTCPCCVCAEGSNLFYGTAKPFANRVSLEKRLFTVCPRLRQFQFRIFSISILSCPCLPTINYPPLRAVVTDRAALYCTVIASAKPEHSVMATCSASSRSAFASLLLSSVLRLGSFFDAAWIACSSTGTLRASIPVVQFTNVRYCNAYCYKIESKIESMFKFAGI
jgi:hypothetical protein